MTESNKAVATFFYTGVVGDQFRHQCNYCQLIIKQDVSKGYNNLISHVKGQHSDYATLMTNHARDAGTGSAVPGT